MYIYMHIYTILYIYNMLTFVIMKVLWTSKSRPSKTEHNEKKKSNPSSWVFHELCSISGVTPCNRYRGLGQSRLPGAVISIQIIPIRQRVSKKKRLDIEICNLRFPSVDIRFLSITAFLKQHWHAAHSGRGPTNSSLCQPRREIYFRVHLVWPEMEIRLKDSLQHFRDTCCNTRNEVQVQCAPEFFSWLLVYWVLTKSRTFENSQRLLLHVLALHGVVMNFLQAILYTKCHGKFMEMLLESTPLKINMEHSHGGLEDHFPFQMGDL